MCYTIEINFTREEVEKRFGSKLKNKDEFVKGRKISAFSLPKIPVISSENPELIDLMTWGLIPSWTRNEEDAKSIRLKTFNAKAETLGVKPSFRISLRKKRCMVLVNGFYEWQHIGKKKIPYFIALKDQAVFALAGLYDDWTNENTGEYFRTFTVITTPANPMMEVIHNTKKRMPAILPPKAERDWLDLKVDPSELNSFLKPYDEKLMIAEKIESQGSLF